MPPAVADSARLDRLLERAPYDLLVLDLTLPRELSARIRAMLLIAAITLSQIIAALVFIVFVQQPRVRDTAALLARQIMTVQRLLAALPAGGFALPAPGAL